MERIHGINAARIAWCCADNGITPEILAADVNIAPATLHKVMEGKAGLTFNQLRNIAEFFGRGVLFFLEEGPVNAAHVHTAAFRTLANQKPEMSTKIKALIERVEKQRDVYLSLREDIDDDTSRFAAPDLPVQEVKRSAEIVRSWLGLTDVNDFDSYRAAIEAKGILVFRSNGYNGKWQIAKESPILGFSLYHRDCPVIVIKKQRRDAQQSFTLLHELGHLLLDRSSSIDDENDLYDAHTQHEQRANAFAGYVLVPDRLLQMVDDTTRPDDVAEFGTWLDWARKAWGVSAEVILRRLRDVGRLDQDDYTAYREWVAKLDLPDSDGGTRMYRHREPKHIFGDRFVRTVLDSLSSGYITLNKASSYLDGLKISDLHELERYYARP